MAGHVSEVRLDTDTLGDFRPVMATSGMCHAPPEPATFPMCYGIQFADIPKNRSKPTARYRGHPFDRACLRNGIEHRLTKPNHPWTNGQVERMNRTLKEATVRRYHYDTRDQLAAHLSTFLDAYNFARRLKTLSGLSPYEAICNAWTKQPDRFRLDPTHLMAGLNT